MAASNKTGQLTVQERMAIATAPGWRPTEGDLLENATVVRLSMGTTTEYGDYPKVTYRLMDGTYVCVHAFHTLLRESLAELKTEIGSVQNVAYLGRKTSNSRTDSKGDPQEYEMYYVENVSDDMEIAAVEEGFSF